MINGENVLYKRFTRTLNDPGKLIPVTDNPYNHVKEDIDYYTSLYNYNDKHYKQFLEKGTISGIEDVTTTRLLFDFDASPSKNSTFEDARNGAIRLIERFKQNGIDTDAIGVFYSGGKGFHVELETNTVFTPEEFRNTVFGLAKDLKGFDTTINNASRVIRLALTKHDKTGLYKVPLTLEFLKGATEDDIKSYALELEGGPEEYTLNSKKVALPESILKLKIVKKEEKPKDIVIIKELDLTKKPTWLTSCKYALSQGHFKEGMRSNTFTSLAATYASQGLPEDVVLGMLRGVANIQAKLNNSEPFHERDLRRIVDSVFEETWNGGTYTCRTPGWLQDYCKEHGFDCQREDEEVTIDFKEGLQSFSKYANEIDSNTIKTGIKELDDKLRIQVGQLVGFLASAGVGKTSFALSMLNNTSLAGINSLFFSYDMHKDILFQKIIQRETGYTDRKVFEIYKNNDVEQINKFDEVLSKNYSNVWFCTKPSQSLKQIKNTIKHREQLLGQPIKFIVVDYLELIQTDYSDATASSMTAIQGLREIANEMNKAVIVLLQPNKMSTKLNEPITSYTAAKGSSSIAQAVSSMITAHRPGYSSREPEKDRFFSIDVVKNRTGPLFSLDFAWEGLTGRISELSPLQRGELTKVRSEIKASKLVEDEF